MYIMESNVLVTTIFLFFGCRENIGQFEVSFYFEKTSKDVT